MISVCFGDIVFPEMTRHAIMMFGMRAYLIFFTDKIVRATNDISNVIPSAINLGSPSGMPSTPVTLIAIKTAITFFCKATNKKECNCLKS